MDISYVISETESLIQICEGTGKFLPTTFGSRRFFLVGEFQLAFNGIYRFAEGNAEFRATLPSSYRVLLELYKDEELGPMSTQIYNWQTE